MISSVSSGSSSQATQMLHRRGGGKGKGPELPSGFKSIIDSAVQSGGSADDIKSTVQSKFADYQKTDEYKALPADQQKKLTELVAKGPPRGGPGAPPPTGDASAAASTTDSTSTTSKDDIIKSLMNQLAQQGEQTRNRLLGSDSTTDESSAFDVTDQAA